MRATSAGSERAVSSLGASFVPARAGEPARLPCTGGTLPRRRSGARRKGRGAARPFRRRDRSRSLARSSRTAQTSSGSSASSFGAAEGCSPAPSARSTASSRPRPGGRARPAAAGRRRAGGGRAARRRSGPTAAVGARFPGYADALGRALAELDGALARRRRARGAARRALLRAYRDELERLGAWDRGLLRRRAIERLDRRARRRGAAPRLRARLRGPDRRRVAPPRGARGARRRPRLSAVRAGAGRIRVARAHGRRPRARSPAGDIVELPPRADEFLPPALAHVERRAVRDDAGARPARRVDPVPRGRGNARDARARRRGGARLVRGGIAAGGDRGRLPVARRACAPRSRRRSRALGVPVAFEGRDSRSARRRSGTRCSRSSASPGSAASGPSSTRTCARRTRGSRAREVDWVEGRLRGRGVVSGDRAVEVTAELRDGRPLPLLDRVLADDDDPLDAVRAVARRDAPQRARRRRAARSTRGRGSTCGPRRRRRRTLDELEALARAGVATSAARDVLAALERATVAGERPGAPGRVAVLDLLRARTRRFDTVFVLGLEQGTLPRRARRGAVPRRGDAPQLESAAAPASSGPTPRAATATSSRPRAPGRGAGSCSCARPSATRAPARAEPVLGGSARALRPRTTSATRRSAGRSPRSPANRGGADRAGAPAGARPCSRADRAHRSRGARRAERLGAGGSAARRAPSTGRRA